MDAVETQEQVRVHLPDVRRQMASVGIELTTPVRVELRDADWLNGAVDKPGLGTCLGVTLACTWPDDRSVEVRSIGIARGLPPTHFGQTVAHEIGHAWLFQRGVIDLEPALTEGVCELLAGAWLKRCNTPTAEVMRDSLMTNPDPVYGDGYRMVRDAVIRHGVAAVLDCVCERGSLP
jgi:hypothetical protein